MRLLTKTKIYRAYPELDPFSDEVCKRYVRHARRIGGAWWGRLLIVLSIPVTMFFWYVFMRITGDVFSWLVVDPSQGMLGVTLFVVMIVLYTGIGWFPYVCALLIRDFTLRQLIRRRLDGVECPECGYTLIGLTIFDEDGARCVQCPECGKKTALNEGHITEADINPALLVES